MQTVILVVLLIVAIPVGWWLIKLFAALATPPERSGRAFLKDRLIKLGVDAARIPDSALNEIVEHCISAAKSMAELYQVSSIQNAAEHKNWRANLVRQLEARAYVIKESNCSTRCSCGLAL